MNSAWFALKGVAPKGFGVRARGGKCQVFIAHEEILAEADSWDEAVGIVLAKTKGR